ncbi:MAG: hypothetical protein NC221_00085 [Duncaniella sp.]|nr:hypothetical protein [Duncaniella sp.]
MTVRNQEAISDCYVQYCAVIKPLIARIEALSEKIPLSIFNEIRAFNDHIARCYYNSPTEKYIEEQIDKANRHIVRISLDCFKCLNVILFSKIEDFERHTKNVDLTVIDNGLFFQKYSRQKFEAAQLVNEAKIAESVDSDNALELYQAACNIYSQIVVDINKTSDNVKWAKIRFTTRRFLTILGWIISIVVSAILSAIFSCEIIAQLTTNN